MPLFRGHTAFRSKTSSVVHRSHEVCPPWCSSVFPLAGVLPKLPRPFHTEIPSCRPTFASTRSWSGPGASPLRPEGLLAEPSASDPAGTSCRRMQPTF